MKIDIIKELKNIFGEDNDVAFYSCSQYLPEIFQRHFPNAEGIERYTRRIKIKSSHSLSDLKRFFGHLSPNMENQILEDISRYADEYCVSKDDLGWINPNNGRMIDFIWLTIQKISISENKKVCINTDSEKLGMLTELMHVTVNSRQDRDKQPLAPDFLDDFLKEKSTCIDRKKKYKLILKLFSSYIPGRWVYKTKVRSLSLINKAFIKAISENTAPKFVAKKNHDQCSFIWEYLKKHHWADPDISEVQSENETYESIISSIDTYQCHPAEKQLFLEKMRKAWSQKSRRDRLKETKKSHTFELPNQTSEQLEQLSEQYNVNKTVILQAVIEQAIDSRHPLNIERYLGDGRHQRKEIIREQEGFEVPTRRPRRSRSERSRSERSRSERSRSERGRSERSRSERSRSERGRSERGRSERGRLKENQEPSVYLDTSHLDAEGRIRWDVLGKRWDSDLE